MTDRTLQERTLASEIAMAPSIPPVRTSSGDTSRVGGCPCCGTGRPTNPRPNVLRHGWYGPAPVKVCAFCDRTLTDFQILQFCSGMSAWYRQERALYGRQTDDGVKIIHTLEDGNFYSPVLISDLGGLKRFPRRGRKKMKVKVTKYLGDGKNG